MEQLRSWISMPQREYVALEESDGHEVDDGNSHVCGSRYRKPITSHYAAHLFWAVLTLTLTLLLLLAVWQDTLSADSDEKGFATDFSPARTVIDLVQVKFTSGVYIDSGGDFHLASHPEVATYVGAPSASIDKAWDEIMNPEWFDATRDEIREQSGSEALTRLAHDANGMYSAQLDVFHSLHCLDQLRRAIDREHYYPSYGPRSSNYTNYMHWDHCIDQLRQNIQCHGDATMNGAIWYEGGQKAFVDTENVHTCRDFGKLREWANLRARDTSS